MSVWTSSLLVSLSPFWRYTVNAVWFSSLPLRVSMHSLPDRYGQFPWVILFYSFPSFRSTFPLSLLCVSPNFRLPCCRSFPWIFLSFFCICQRKRAEKNFFVFYLSFSLLFFHCPFFESASLQHSQWITLSTFSQSLSSIPILKPSWRESSVNEIKDWFLWGTTLWSGLMIDFRESNLVYRGDPLVCWKKSRCATGHSFIEMVNFE